MADPLKGKRKGKRKRGREREEKREKGEERGGVHRRPDQKSQQKLLLKLKIFKLNSFAKLDSLFCIFLEYVISFNLPLIFRATLDVGRL